MASTVASPPRPAPRRLAPAPPPDSIPPPNKRSSTAVASTQPSSAGPASLKELLSDRGSWMAPPSPSSQPPIPASTGPFDSPTRAPAPAFHFPHHLPLTPKDSVEGDDLPILSSGLPASPHSMSDQSYSPSPSLASVRTAKVGTRVLPTRTAAPRSLHTPSATTTSIETSTTESAYSEDAHPVASTSTGLADAFQLTASKSRTPSPPIPQQPTVRVHRRSASADSRSSSKSWKRNLEAAFVDVQAAQDPRLKPEVDAMARMTSILGPKMKIISKAPWDDIEREPSPPPRTSTSAKRKQSAESSSQRPISSATVASQDSRKEPAKENVKPKSGSSGRSRSFSVLTSRLKSPTHDKELDDALVGLGLGNTAPSKLPTSPANNTGSFLDMGESKSPSKSRSTPASPMAQARKGSAPPDLVGRSFPSSSSIGSSALPSPPLSLSKSHGKLSSSRGRVPAPVVFDMIAPGSSLSLPSPSSPAPPHSAPAHMLSFSASDDPTSRTLSNTVTSTPLALAPRLQTSASALSVASSGSISPGLTPRATSPTSPLASPFNGGYFPSTGAPSGPGYKLISLEEARQREVERIAVAAAHRKAMEPVEHIARRNDDSQPHTRVSSGTSTIGPRTSSGRDTPSSISTTQTASSAGTRSLKSKKSGFLKRMMGGDKASQPPLPSTGFDGDESFATPVESFRALPDDYVHSPAVTVSAPSATPGLEAPLATSTNRVAFLNAPVPDPELRLRKGLAPSLSLRPISMAFSAGLPTDFLAEQEAASATPRKVAAHEIQPSVQSPLAPSFHSNASAKRAPSFFDSDSASFVSSVATPVTPGFSPHPPFSPSEYSSISSPSEPGGHFAGLQDEFLKAQKLWKMERLDLESQIRSLNAELEKARSAASIDETEIEPPTCEHCGIAQPLPAPKQPESVLSRPRFKGNGGTGTLFGSLMT